jgi:hypothetical protein
MLHTPIAICKRHFAHTQGKRKTLRSVSAGSRNCLVKSNRSLVDVRRDPKFG